MTLNIFCSGSGLEKFEKLVSGNSKTWIQTRNIHLCIQGEGHNVRKLSGVHGT